MHPVGLCRAVQAVASLSFFRPRYFQLFTVETGTPMPGAACS